MKSEYRKHIDKMFDYAINATSQSEVLAELIDWLSDEDLLNFINTYCDEHDCYPHEDEE